MYNEDIKTDVVYLDDDHHIVDEEKATRMIIRDYDKEGNLINETFMVVNRKKESNEKRTYDLSQEQIDFIKQFNLNADINDILKK